MLGMSETRNINIVLSGDIEGRNRSVSIGVDGRIILS
jgi:hypothetical protein